MRYSRFWAGLYILVHVWGYINRRIKLVFFRFITRIAWRTNVCCTERCYIRKEGFFFFFHFCLYLWRYLCILNRDKSINRKLEIPNPNHRHRDFYKIYTCLFDSVGPIGVILVEQFSMFILLSCTRHHGHFVLTHTHRFGFVYKVCECLEQELGTNIFSYS